MTEPARRLRAVLLAGLLYLVIGLGTAALARQGGAAWRIAAWLLSAIVFATHIGYELSRLRSSPTTTAFHAALGVALGALGLAAAATIRAVTTGNYRSAFLLALVAWPLMTGIAAFVAAWVMVTVVRLLGRTTRSAL